MTSKPKPRAGGRAAGQLRPVSIERNVTRHAEGSALICCGDTRVICTASVEAGTPRFIRVKGRGWITAEYGMLPRSTTERTRREAVGGGQAGRTQEIQRLIGRALRAAVDPAKLGAYTIIIDCDVIQADGGTRAAAITGGCVALVDALRYMQRKGKISEDPLRRMVASVSAGVVRGRPVLDLDYAEDSRAGTDMTVVMAESGRFIELQGTAEGAAFGRAELDELLDLAAGGVKELIALQKAALESVY